MWQRYMYNRELKTKVNNEEIKRSQEKAHQIALNQKDIQKVGDFSQNLAFLTQNEGEDEKDPVRKKSKFKEAIEKYTDLLLVRQLAGDERGKAMTLDRRAECQLNLAKLDLDEAAKIYQERGDKEGLERIKERKNILLE